MTILESAYDDADPLTNAHLYAACALVCRAWSVPAQKLLFRHVALRSGPACAAFALAVDPATPRGRMLGAAVRTMRATLDPSQPYALGQRAFARAVTLCPNLDTLSLALYGRDSASAAGTGADSGPAERPKVPASCFSERTLALLRSGPRIRALQLNNWSDDAAVLAQLLGVWPSLASLAIAGTPPQLPGSSPAPLPCTLAELSMNFQTQPSLEFVKWLLQNSKASLRTLEFAREPSLDMLEHLAADHGATLQSLALPTYCGHDGVAALRTCRALRELRVENAWVPPALVNALPGKMEHLAFGIDDTTALAPVVSAIKRSAALKAVTVHMWRGGEQNPKVNAVKIACARLGVELRITKDVRDFRAISRAVLDASS
ncbi:hypothetical protein WOLCODRAFT_135684 [Wolfiporia cocos MD-104 SS10]|uniref:F-box domain-containing protein n=1 Tax=Wolfiporia cocos (strain MD-104) TaxID=742152 RepID=A0A2H3J6L9_WOLCO|nr:hypothetical protein WOLCODRAFT_135684 [Wolfiporia cocos MD-104 SS10]